MTIDFAKMLRAAGRNVTVIDETRNPALVADEVGRVQQARGPLATVTTKGLRTILSRAPGGIPYEREVEIVLALEAPGASAIGPHHTLAVAEGGPTGYERIYIQLPGDEPGLSVATIWDLSQNGWVACAGTSGRWDRLFIPPESLGPALAELVKAVGR